MQFEELKFNDKEKAKAFISMMEAEVKQEQGDIFHITDEDHADWVISKITAIEDEIDRLKHQHERRIKQLENEKKFFELRFGTELEGFVRANLNGRMEGRNPMAEIS